MVTEIGQKEVEIQPGYVGNLTPDQEEKLQELWMKFFKTCENASEDDVDNEQAKGKGGDLGGWDEKKSGPDGAGIPKDDKAKDELKAREEQAALDELLQTYGPSALRNTFWKFVKMDNPDTDVLRFLRARKWDVSRAFAMMAGCMKWRLDNNVEELGENGDLGNASIEKFLDQQRSGKTYAMGTTDNEQPICYIHVKKHMTWGQPGASMSKYVIYAMESFRLLMQPPNDKVVLLFDLTGFGLKNMDWNCILFIVKCLEAYYPESLGTLYIHNAPWIFSGIWKLLGPMLDPVVRSKVKFTKKPEDLDIVPKERLLSNMGGDNINEFEFVEPEEGENEQTKDEEGKKRTWNNYMSIAKQYEQVTRKWCETKGKDKDVVKQRELLVKKLRVAQFEHEPYFRGKTVYHRDGTIDGEGVVTWNYKQKDGEIIRHAVGRRSCVATLKKEIAEIEGGADPEEVEKRVGAKADKEAGKENGAAGAAAGGGAAAATAAAVAADDDDNDAFHEAPVATKAATNEAIDANTEKVISHDEQAAKEAPPASNGHSNGDATGPKQTASKADTEKLPATDYKTEDASDRHSIKKSGSIKSIKSSGFAKLKSVLNKA
ncbi:related to CSR1-phosphatidylinositol transfer protein [Sporisorium scitamineum]|uniref:Related to CSR1-phosphatidylinositol transfer protein n=1 Tax=Sporisorium scitamineum TaxID=49012 RepID=A0A127ZDC0_9BASI|nr:related to CSR1-phosphatidylinositol transfer protein [Sporisorium scitamineum]